MRFLGIILIFGGYMLVYSSVAGGGKFATDPWASLYADAYTESTDPAQRSSPADTGLLPTTSARQRTLGVPGVPRAGMPRLGR